MEHYWKVREVAAALQISAQTVYRYVANGKIPFHKLNRSVRFKPSEIERWIESKGTDIPAAQSGSLDESVMENARTEGGEI
jgi:excisionase family DNA binding protein